MSCQHQIRYMPCSQPASQCKMLKSYTVRRERTEKEKICLCKCTMSPGAWLHLKCLQSVKMFTALCTIYVCTCSELCALCSGPMTMGTGMIFWVRCYVIFLLFLSDGGVVGVLLRPLLPVRFPLTPVSLGVDRGEGAVTLRPTVRGELRTSCATRGEGGMAMIRCSASW